MGLGFLTWMELFYRRVISYKTMKETPIAAETVAVRQKNHRILPTDEFSTHLEDRAVRIYRAFLVQHFIGGLGRVNDDERLAEDSHRANISYNILSTGFSSAAGIRHAINFSPTSKG